MVDAARGAVDREPPVRAPGRLADVADWAQLAAHSDLVAVVAVDVHDEGVAGPVGRAQLVRDTPPVRRDGGLVDEATSHEAPRATAVGPDGPDLSGGMARVREALEGDDARRVDAELRLRRGGARGRGRAGRARGRGRVIVAAGGGGQCGGDEERRERRCAGHALSVQAARCRDVAAALHSPYCRARAMDFGCSGRSRPATTAPL